MKFQKLLGMVSKEEGSEQGVDPIPVEKGPYEPLIKAWNVVGAWPLSVALMSTTFGVSLPLTLITPMSRFQRKGPAQIMGLCLNATLSRVKVTLHPDFDKDRPAVLCMNHTSMLDAHLALHAIPQTFCGIMHAHHFKFPIYGWLMKSAGGIGVEKKGQGQFADVRQQMLERVERGISILVFPEGRRTQNGRILPFRLGVFRMARDAGMPVVPVAVRGLWQVLRRGEWIARPGKIEVYIGPQIEVLGMSDDELGILAERMQGFVSDFVERGVLGDPSKLSPRA